MRLRAMFILATIVLGVMLLGGAALVVTKACGDNPCVGTNREDKLIGNEKKNQIYGRGGDDVIMGRQNNDHLYGGPDDDTSV